MQTLGLFGAQLSEYLDVANVMSRQKAALNMEAVGRAAPAAFAVPADSMETDSVLLSATDSDWEGGEEEAQVMVRSEFADLVKWVGAVTTDGNGEAEIKVEYPDNLTTWKLKVWALGKGTRVGEGSAEVITSKDLIVRLQAPRFFVEKDEVVLSAVVHNYHEETKEVKVSLELEGGVLDAIGSRSANVVIPGGGEQRVDWRVVARREGVVMIRMKAVAHGGDGVLDAGDDSDAMEMEFPVYVHGMLRTESWSRTLPRDKDAVSIDFEVPEDRRPDQSRLEVRFSPTIAGSMVDALPYLASYPYGSTENTVSRFVPAVITQRLLRDMQIDLAEVRNKRTNLNPQEVGDARDRASQWKVWEENPVWEVEKVNRMVRKGVKRLREMRNGDGGWGWFSAYGSRSYPHTTAIVVHGLTVAKENGASVPEELLRGGIEWLKRYESGQTEMIRFWKKRKKKTKKRADALDALIRRVLGATGADQAEMLGFLKRDRVHLPVYAKCLLGLELHRTGAVKERDETIRNIEQFLKQDPENQTAWLELGNGGYWWRWYGSEFEAHACYLKLLAVAKPRSAQASGLAKYLVTLGPYWSEKFKQEGISPNKIITGFFPFQYREFKIEGAQSVLVILGAGQEIYQHSVQLKDWVKFLDRCGIDRANIVVRPHPKTSEKNLNDIVKFGLTVKKDQDLDAQIHKSSAVCLDRSTVMLRCVQMNKPIIFYEDLPEAFLDISEMGFRLLTPTEQDAACRYYASDREWLVGSEEKAIKTIKDVLERNEHALSE